METITEPALSYIPLPYILDKNTYTYVLYQKGNKTMIYEQRVGSKIIAYEVFKRKINPARVFKEFVFPAKERFPRDEDFGYTAWACRTKKRALKRFNELENV